MGSQGPVCRMDVVLVRLESGQPMVQVDILLESADRIRGDSAFDHVMDHAFGADLLGSAVGVPYDHDVLHSQLVDRHQHRAHGLPERIRHASAGVFDEHDIAVLKAEGGWKEMDEAGVHAGYDGRSHPGIFGGGVLVVLLVVHEFAVVADDPVDHSLSHLILESMAAPSSDQRASSSAGLKVPGPLQFPSAISAATLNAVMAAAMDSTDAPHAPA